MPSWLLPGGDEINCGVPCSTARAIVGTLRGISVCPLLGVLVPLAGLPIPLNGLIVPEGGTGILRSSGLAGTIDGGRSGICILFARLLYEAGIIYTRNM